MVEDYLWLKLNGRSGKLIWRLKLIEDYVFIGDSLKIYWRSYPTNSRLIEDYIKSTEDLLKIILVWLKNVKFEHMI